MNAQEGVSMTKCPRCVEPTILRWIITEAAWFCDRCCGRFKLKEVPPPAVASAPERPGTEAVCKELNSLLYTLDEDYPKAAVAVREAIRCVRAHEKIDRYVQFHSINVKFQADCRQLRALLDSDAGREGETT
jgi:hypothetical protein